MDRPFLEQEVYFVVFQVSRYKALGLDGFKVALYQVFWDVIKDDVVKVFKVFHSFGKMH